MQPFVQVVLQITHEFSQKELEGFLRGKGEKSQFKILAESLNLFNQGAIGKLTRLLQNKLFPREAAIYISKGVMDENHIGKHSDETITQEVFSLTNTKKDFRDNDWHIRLKSIFKRANKDQAKQIKQTFPDENL